MAQLVDQYNNPIIPAELVREKAAPTLTGIRRIWDESVASGLTPYKLATLLRAAAEGDADAYLTLAEEMEERDPHYSCELGKRKLAVSRLPATIEAAGDDQKSIDIADACRNLIKGAGFRLLLKDLLDGLGKGFSVAEIIWDKGAKQWTPKRYEWRDPHFFQFDQVTRREIRLRDEADLVNGLPLTPYGFICHIPRLKSGIPIRSGFARMAAWSFMCKGYTIKDWLAFAEVFGMPLRLGKYGSGATEADKDVLRMAVANLGSDAGAIFPDSMMLELVERKGTGGETVYQVLAQYIDDQISKGILGQTASSAGGAAGLGNDKLQSDVRDDIRDDDAEQLEATLQRDLIEPFVILNFGPQEIYPTLQLRAVDPVDTAALVNALEKLVPLGLRVEQSVVRDKIGLPDPDKNAKPEDLLGAPVVAPAPVGAPLAAPALVRANNRQQIADEPFTPEQQALEDLADRAIAAASIATAANERLLLEAIQSASSYDDAMERVLSLWPQMNLDKVADLLEACMIGAHSSGIIDVNAPSPVKGRDGEGL